jgi:hypothetical protein
MDVTMRTCDFSCAFGRIHLWRASALEEYEVRHWKVMDDRVEWVQREMKPTSTAVVSATSMPTMSPEMLVR